MRAGLIVREIDRAAHAARILVLSPASVRSQWMQELDALFNLAVVDADTAWLRRASRDLPADVNPWSLPGVYLASIDFVKRPEALHPLESVRWDLVVIDEAHAATPGSDRRAAVHALALRSHRVLLLTATPHSGDDAQFTDLCAIQRTRILAAHRHLQPHAARYAVGRHGHPKPLSRGPVVCSPSTTCIGCWTGSTTRIWAESAGRPDRKGELIAAVLRKRALSARPPLPCRCAGASS